MELREEPLYHIWKNRLFRTPLFDLDETEVGLVDPGRHNRDSGPDFLDARIRSEGILWAGNVEIHRKASEWYQHGHHLDPAFDNVILHVVLDPDCQVRNSRGREIRTVRLEIPPEILRRFELLIHYPGLMPGGRLLTLPGPDGLESRLEKLLLERLGERAARIRADLVRCGGDWGEVLYRSLARAIGQKVNADPFEMLARSLSLGNLLRYGPDLVSKEALLFGQAGMLGGGGRRTGQIGEWGRLKEGTAGDGKAIREVPGTGAREYSSKEDPYIAELRARYETVRERIGLQPVAGSVWKFLRLRPDNFPTVRISQLACSLENYPDLYRRLRDHPDPLDFVLKMELKASEYWNTHYRFGRESPPREKSPGRERMTGLFVNAVLPVLFAESSILGDSRRADELRNMLVRVPPENNRIVRMWKNLGIGVPDGFTSQALLQLAERTGLI